MLTPNTPWHIVEACHSAGMELFDLSLFTGISERRLLSDDLDPCEKLIVITTLIEHHDAFASHANAAPRGLNVPLPDDGSPRLDRAAVHQALDKLLQDVRDELGV
jgi:hypothetical protein